jgi:hypothetical protein
MRISGGSGGFVSAIGEIRKTDKDRACCGSGSVVLTKEKGLDFSRPQNWAVQHPATRLVSPLLSISVKLLLLELIPVFAPTELRFERSVDPRDSNPHLLPSQGAVFPLHHGPEATLQLKLLDVTLRG